MVDSRQQAHELIELLPDAQIEALVGFLSSIVEPGTSLKGAPFDDEPEMDSERAAVAEARASLEQNGGRGVPHREAMRRLGIG